jgi:hypothetical protein
VATASPVKKEEREENQVAHLNKYDDMGCLSMCRCHLSAYHPPLFAHVLLSFACVLLSFACVLLSFACVSLSFACVSSSFVHVLPSSVRCWLPRRQWRRGPCFLCKKRRGGGEGTIVVCLCIIVVRPCIIIVRPCVTVVRRCWLPCRQWRCGPCFPCEKRRGGGEGTLLTLINMKNDDTRHQCLDDVACQQNARLSFVCWAGCHYTVVWVS